MSTTLEETQAHDSSQESVQMNLPSSIDVFPTPDVHALTDQQALLELWLETLSSAWKKSMFPGTIRALFSWASSHGKTSLQLSLAEINEFVTDHYEHLNKTLAHQALIGFYAFAAEQGLIKVSPVPKNYPRISRVAKAFRRSNQVTLTQSSVAAQIQQLSEAIAGIAETLARIESALPQIKLAQPVPQVTTPSFSYKSTETRQQEYLLTLSPVARQALTEASMSFSYDPQYGPTRAQFENWIISLLENRTFQQVRDLYRLTVNYTKHVYGDQNPVAQCSDVDFYDLAERV